MKKIIIILILLVPGWAWGATVYVGKASGSVYYQSGASDCTDIDVGDTAGDLEDAEEATSSGILYICAADYAVSEVDGDSILGVTSVLHIEKGTTIRGQLTLGHNTGPVAFGSGAKPIITGMDVITTFSLESGTVYSKASITTEPNFLTYDGTNFQRVEIKLTFDAGNTEPTVGEKIEENGGDASGIVMSYVLATGAWDGSATGYINVGHVSGTFGDDEQIDGTVGSTDMLTSDGAGAAATTDLVSNQFAWASDVLYLNAGEDPAGGTVEITQRNLLVYIVGRTGLTLDGFDLQYSTNLGIDFHTSDSIAIKNCDFSYIEGGSGYAVELANSNTGVLIDDNVFLDNEYSIVLINASELSINAVVKMNKISQTAWFRANFIGGAGIAVNKTSGATIDRNHIHDIAGDGIFLVYADSNTVQNNLIVNVADGIAIESSDSNEIYNNTIYGATDKQSGGFNWPRIKMSDNFGAGDDAASNILKNNLLVAISGSGNRRCLNGAAVNTNNTVDYNHYYTTDDADPIHWDEGGGTWSGTLAEFVAAFSTKYEQNSPAQANPLLSDDFRIGTGSPCYQAGDATVNVDHHANGADIGWHDPDKGVKSGGSNYVKSGGTSFLRTDRP